MTEHHGPEQRGIGEANTQAVAGVIIGIAGLVAGLFMPLAAYALGLAAIVLGLLARRRGAGGGWILAVVVALIAIGVGVAAQVYYSSGA